MIICQIKNRYIYIHLYIYIYLSIEGLVLSYWRRQEALCSGDDGQRIAMGGRRGEGADSERVTTYRDSSHYLSIASDGG